jgi:hypothetical protein
MSPHYRAASFDNQSLELFATANDTGYEHFCGSGSGSLTLHGTYWAKCDLIKSMPLLSYFILMKKVGAAKIIRTIIRTKLRIKHNIDFLSDRLFKG